MKELPILFSTPMVQAILENRKTMTRRTAGLQIINVDPDSWRITTDVTKSGILFFNKCGHSDRAKPKYNIGDHLWVREKHETDTDGTVKFYAGNIEVRENKAYERLTKWKPSIFLKKVDARIWLEVTRVRCERLLEISEEDAIAEGMTTERIPFNPETRFFQLWENLHGEKSLEINHWLFVYEFNRIAHA